MIYVRIDSMMFVYDIYACGWMECMSNLQNIDQWMSLALCFFSKCEVAKCCIFSPIKGEECVLP
jgi:hypothetical protein